MDSPLNELFVEYKNIQKDVRINRRNHHPRTSSMNLSTDLYPSFSKLFLEYPFHFLRLSFDDAFFSWMAPLTTTNSTSVSGPSPNSSRISFGIVTWPRSPIFILLSMYQESYSVNIYYNEESPPLAYNTPLVGPILISSIVASSGRVIA